MFKLGFKTRLFRTKDDFVMINRWTLPTDIRKATRFTRKDFLYILFYTLIVIGLVHKIETIVHKPVTQALDKVHVPKVIAAPSKNTAPQKIITKIVTTADKRATQLEKFLNDKGSPLAPLAAYMVRKSDDNGLDWTLMPSISGKESTFGLFTKPDSHNPFGLGGTKFMYFDSWEEAIDFEANLLNKYYRENMVSGIQGTYCPDSECASDWTSTVVSFSNELLFTK